MQLDGRRVLITGHTGFKGGWLALYAHRMGVEVGGYSLGRSTGPSFYHATGLRRFLAHETRGDVTDPVALRQCLRAFRPHVVLHLAARAIVRDAIEDPFGTTHANVMGTAAVLEAVRHSPWVEATIVVTTDKVYANDGTPCREADALGGTGPYGASKAAAEMVVRGYRKTFGLHVATARSGNVVGGGDWGAHRLVPNCLRAFARGEPVTVYDATRPFLHVLDSARGYLMLASALVTGTAVDTLNFGPEGSCPVQDVAHHMARRFGGDVIVRNVPPKMEAHTLTLDASKARAVLEWAPHWSLTEALDHTADWHKAYDAGSDMELVSLEQIDAHDGSGLEWREDGDGRRAYLVGATERGRT